VPDPPSGVKRDHPLARLTTIRTGGSAEFFSRPATVEELHRLLAWAGEEELEVGVVGSGSNLLVADDGVRGLVLKLDGDLNRIELDPPRILCGGGARLPAVAAAAAKAGLSGIEFGVNIPGTVGGAVRMNANAYGGVLAEVLDWVEVVGPDGRSRRTPQELGFAYRRSNLAPREVVASAQFSLSAATAEQVKATLADLRARRKAAQPSGIKTFGSTFKNPQDPRAEGHTAGQLLDAAGCRGLRVGGAGFSEKHANFVENHGDATTADVVALMAEGRRRVSERFGIALEPEVQGLGPVPFPADWWPAREGTTTLGGGGCARPPAGALGCAPGSRGYRSRPPRSSSGSPSSSAPGGTGCADPRSPPFTA
jgi:UDP-N-acetylenolpyruvoylglucosamine reductase